MKQPFQIDVFMDLICPWCFLGKRQLERALGDFGEGSLELCYRPYLLNPDLPSEGVARAEYFRKRFGTDPAALSAAHARLRELGSKVGIAFAFDLAERIPNTVPAHALVRWAAESGNEGRLIEKVFSAYFSEGRDIGLFTTLGNIAAEVGLDQDEALEKLGREAYFDEVRQDADAARREGIAGVPFFVLGGKLSVSGAQPPGILAKAIHRAISS